MAEILFIYERVDRSFVSLEKQQLFDSTRQLLQTCGTPVINSTASCWSPLLPPNLVTIVDSTVFSPERAVDHASSSVEKCALEWLFRQTSDRLVIWGWLWLLFVETAMWLLVCPPLGCNFCESWCSLPFERNCQWCRLSRYSANISPKSQVASAYKCMGNCKQLRVLLHRLSNKWGHMLLELIN